MTNEIRGASVLDSWDQPIVPRIVIILAHGSALEQAEGLLASLAEPTEPSLSVELLLIGTPKDRREREGKVARLKLDERRRVGLSVVEALSDKSSDLIDAVSKGLQLAAQAKRDAIVVSARSSFGCDAILELLAVGDGDPLLGFVEAAVSDEDDPAAESGAARPESGHQGALILEGMPRSSYVPIVEGPLVLIKSLMLQEFRLLDCGFNNLASALSDFALRANRCGYRVVARQPCPRDYQETGKSRPAFGQARSGDLACPFSLSCRKKSRAARLGGRKARKLLAGLRRDCRWPAQHCLCLQQSSGPIHNGTSELAKRIITEFSSNYSSEYNIHVLCSRMHSISWLW